MKVWDFLRKHTWSWSDFTYDFEQFATQAFLLVTALPGSVIESLLEFRRHSNDDGVIVVRGLPIDDRTIGPTPKHWADAYQTKSSCETEMYLVGCASILGEVFTFDAHYNNMLVQNIVPMQEHAARQAGTSSSVFLDWHTESADHQFRADFIGLLCVRSDPLAATTFASIRRMHLSDRHKKELFEKNFYFGTDIGTLFPILFGRYEDPYIRFNVQYMQARSDRPEAQEALVYLLQEIPRAAYQLVLQQGDLLLLDNYRVVHGRTAFIPRFDGRDRWLQRVHITSSLRKSQVARAANSRVVETHPQFLK